MILQENGVLFDRYCYSAASLVVNIGHTCVSMRGYLPVPPIMENNAVKSSRRAYLVGSSKLEKVGNCFHWILKPKGRGPGTKYDLLTFQAKAIF
jgi:hypothetical protein